MAVSKTAFYILVFSLSITNPSCESTSRTPPPEPQYNDIYLDQFKLTYFRQLLKKSFNNSKAVQEIINSDHSGFTEQILSDDDYKLIDSLTSRANEELIADSIESNLRAEGAQGKRPLGYIMDKLMSKWLDSIAKRRLKISDSPSGWID